MKKEDPAVSPREPDGNLGEHHNSDQIPNTVPSEEFYQMALYHSIQGHIVLQDDVIIFVNQAFADMLGYTIAEMLAMKMSEPVPFLYSEGQALILQRYQQRLRGEPVPSMYPIRCLHKNGGIRWVELSAKRIMLRGRPAVQAVGVDITDRKRAEGELKQSEARMRLALDVQGATIWDYDVKTRKMYVDDRAKVGLGLSRESDLSLQSSDYWHTVVHPEDLPRVREAMAQHLAGETSFLEVDMRVRHVEGHYLWSRTRAMVIERDEQSMPKRVIGTAIDITDRKRDEQQLVQYQERLKALATELVKAEERERRKIAATLHDQIGQNLVSCKLMVDSILLEQPMQPLVKVSHILGQVIEQTQSLNEDLASPTLYELGLIPALEEWLEEVMASPLHDLVISLHQEGFPEIEDQDLKALLFRTIKELAFNVIKHAQARKLRVELVGGAQFAEILVTDDGKGFDYEKTRCQTGQKGGFGLFSIRERIENLNGIFEVKSEPGQGACIRLGIPSRSNRDG